LAVDFVHDKVADIALDMTDYTVQPDTIAVNIVHIRAVEVGLNQEMSIALKNYTHKWGKRVHYLTPESRIFGKAAYITHQCLY
jgi:hypothetical protein